MNYLHLKHRKLSEVLTVPEGLRELMSDITREVLRYQPENIEGFIADYLEAMLLTRELYLIANQTIEDVLDASFQIVEMLQKDGVTMKQAESVVNVLREEFRDNIDTADEASPLNELDVVNRLVNECGLSPKQAERASEVIESAWCHYYQRNKSHTMKINPDIAQCEAVKNTLEIYQKSKATCNELGKSSKVLQTGFNAYSERKSKAAIRDSRISYANWRTPNFQARERAALKIQSWFRGCKQRIFFESLKCAVVVIQAGFKGYQTRKKLKQPSVIRTDLENEEREQAAITIQSYYRAFKMRTNYQIKQKAAVMIQRHFKDFLTRKNAPEKN